MNVFWMYKGEKRHKNLIRGLCKSRNKNSVFAISYFTMNSNMDTLILNSHCATKIDMENRQSYVIITGGADTSTHLLIFNTTSEFKQTDGKFTANPRAGSS